MSEITDLLKAWSNGDKDAFNRLQPYVDHELKRIARNFLSGEKSGHILSTTALVNEALMKLIQENIDWKDRQHFYAFVAKRMRQVLIDDALKRQAQKRAWGVQESISEAENKSAARAKELVLLGEALNELCKFAPRQVEIVESKFFIGSTLEEIASQTNLSVATVQREWRAARAWLELYMTDHDEC